MVIIDIVINTFLGRQTLAHAGMHCPTSDDAFHVFLVTGRMPRSGKLPVLNLLRDPKSGFSPRMGDSLHPFTSNWAGPTGTLVRLGVQNFTLIGARRVGMRPKI